MTPLSYNLSIAAGVGLTAIGAGAQWGWPVGALAAGLLVIALSLVALRLVVGR
jgi:hypothetical protein